MDETTEVTINLPTRLVVAARAKANERHSTLDAELGHALRTQLMIEDLNELVGFQTPEDVVYDAQNAFEVAERRRRGRSAA